MYTKLHKRLVLVIGFCLCVMFGSGVGTALAGQDAGTMLENWFNGKRSQSVNEIDGAITAEKERLMGELRLKLNESIGSAANELDAFTAAEKQRRVKALNDYAASLMAGIGQGNADWGKDSYLADVQKAVDKAIQEIDKAAEKAKKNAEKNKGKEQVPAAVTEPVKQESPADQKPADLKPAEKPATPAQSAPPAETPATQSPPGTPAAETPAEPETSEDPTAAEPDEAETGAAQ
ncbi:hypothetical protein ACFFIY_04870 [Bhargavaea ullalensis]|uniref:Ribosome-associated translation inhibitor RaiA n=1 Tax=Bhargavaea ullalensis TaxID=1265685 RepID=A0ABV2G9Q4_9BACL